MLNVSKIRDDFPILADKVNGRPLVYLDNAASTLKPRAVIDRLVQYYSHETANVHRGAHFLSSQGTRFYEDARQTVADFVGAQSASEVIFTRGTTESINLVASSFGSQVLRPGDEIILTELEHHSNIVPWQLAAERTGAVIKVVSVYIDGPKAGELDFSHYQKLLSERTKIVSLTWCSNALGTIVPVEQYIEAAHRVGARVLIDAAQSIAHLATDVTKLDCDFLVFSGHKLYGPYGIGVLYAKSELLSGMPPYQGGGSMISEVQWSHSTWADSPHKFEAGTPNVPGALGLASAIRYLKGVGLGNARNHEAALLKLATELLNDVPGLTIHGPRYGQGSQHEKAAIVSFTMNGAHASDIGSVLDEQGIAIRAGHHCCQPLMRRLNVAATARASFSIYNTESDVRAFYAGVLKAKELMS
jgi:cysteine desulfurase/selenocysteine lyase